MTVIRGKLKRETLVETIEIRGERSTSTVIVGETLRNLNNYIEPEKTIIVTDTNVNRYYQGHFPACPVIEIGTGEANKDLKTVRYIYERMIDLGADRSSFLVGIGGGMVCDITGFAASTFMRGIGFGFVATTLLSQVDAGIGGKNGINIKGYKNMAGTFNQPRFVICEIDALKTLPEHELLNGFSELVKHALICDAGLFEFIEKNNGEAIALDRDILEVLITESIRIKKSIVELDERERGPRRKLNFGHTFGHAIEATTGVSHGEAVSIGMTAAVNISHAGGLISGDAVERIRNLFHTLQMPTAVEFDRKKVLEAIVNDKKREGDEIHFVLLTGIGDSTIRGMSIGELEALINDMR